MNKSEKNSVLIVDDQSINIGMLTKILSPEYDIYCTTSGAKAIEIAEKQKPDLILLDIVMPEMDGFEVITQLKNSDKLRHIPVIFITGLTETGDEEKGFSLGAADYITKPFSPAIVKFRVDHHIDQLMRLRESQYDLIKYKMEDEKRRADLAEANSKAKSWFLATMSHEIRTPTSSIMGFAELALNIAHSSQSREYLSKIIESTKWLLRIIDDILDISKIESGKLEFENKPFDLQDILLHCQSVIQPQAAEKGLDLKIYSETVPGKKMLGDPLRLLQVLLNLLSNAVKFTASGTVRASAYIKEIKDNVVVINFEVNDCGIGMTGEQLEKVFMPFVQADSGIARNYGGTGLGLSITKHLVEMMGGGLKVESAPGVGSTFSFEIGFETIEAADEKRFYSENNILEKPHFDAEVLICDDTRLNREVLCEHLKNIGITTVLAGNGIEGVREFEQRRKNNKKQFDLVFMDIFMPAMDGLEAVAKISAICDKTPIIAVTANVMPDDMTKYRGYGMCDCLRKPFTSQQLWGILLKHLKPLYVNEVDEKFLTDEEEKLQNRLKRNFVREYKNVHEEFVSAVDSGKIALAERIVHTLKGNAGQIGQHSLQKAAANAEKALADGQNNLTEKERKVLEAEIKLTMLTLAPTQSGEQTQSTSEDMTDDMKLALIAKLEQMITDYNPVSFGILSQLKAIPGSEKLAELIDNFEFAQAADALHELKESLF